MNIKSIITAAIALLVSTACSGGAKQEKVVNKDGKAIVVFFSHAGDNYAVGNIEVGNTKIVADYITELTGAEQFEIVTHKYDGMAYTPLINLAKEETKKGELPEYEGDVDMSSYDTVFIGGPVWWGTYPQVMFTFFKKHANDLKGKTVIPFRCEGCIPWSQRPEGLQHLRSRGAHGKEKGREVAQWFRILKLEIMEYITLSNGVKMPTLGYGVFLVSPEECERCVSDALSVGYRLIDTAQAYQNEEGVGNAWRKAGLKREDLFLVTKVWISNNGEEKAAKSIDESLRKLQTEYIDLLLIHQAYGDVFGTWRAMEKAYRAGKVRAIGVSNFQAGRFFDFAHYVELKPMVNQLQCNTLIQQTGIEPIHAEFGTKVMAWGPLGGQGVDGIVKSEALTAIGAKYGKSAAQVALRWLTQRGIVAIPKSSHKERMAQNFDVFDFILTDEDMAQIATMNQHDTGTINFGDPQFVKYLIETYG